LINYSFEFYGLAFFVIILLRYFISAGTTHLLLYGAPEHFINSHLSRLKNRPPWPSIRKDIKLSVLSSIIFALGAALVMSAHDSGHTQLYSDIHLYPLWYLGVSYIAAIVLQDTYFYFLHRLFHHPALFRWCHLGHHRSNHPTPWTSFAFDPLEAIGQSLFLVGIVFILPLHFITVIAVLSTMTVWGIVNHLGIDQLPPNFPHHWCGHWFTGPAHHAIHHCQYGSHFGLYFTFWDKQLGTQAPQYEQELTNVTH
jgi:Delta7-sterol 5-desaturase